MKYKKTTATYAKEYDVTTRTIRNWKQKGFHLDDQEKLLEEIGDQKNQPDSLKYGVMPSSAGKRKYPRNAFNVLVMARKMETRINRWGRKLEQAIAAEATHKDRIMIISFTRAMIRREIREGIDDMACAAVGKPLDALKKDRAASEADWWAPDTEEDQP